MAVAGVTPQPMRLRDLERRELHDAALLPEVLALPDVADGPLLVLGSGSNVLIADDLPGTVLVFAPINCTREAAQRARALAQELTQLGIPNVQTSSYAAASFEPTPEALASYQRLHKVMTGEIPIALVNGMGKANPSVADVAAEYARTR